MLLCEREQFVVVNDWVKGKAVNKTKQNKKHKRYLKFITGDAIYSLNRLKN